MNSWLIRQQVQTASPDLVQAAIAGRLPHGMGIARLTDLPAEWSRQYQMLGLPAR